jgi:hypothetical protein
MSWIKSENLSKISGIVHGFSNRRFKGGLKEAASYFGLSRIFTLNQIHSSSVFLIKDGFRKGPEQKGDAIVTSLKGMGIGVFTADCQPLLFVDRTASVVAAVHAGWRGTLSQITKTALLEIEENFGIEPSSVYVVLGPSIGRCCYEVGEDVASLFMNKFDNWKGYLLKKNDSKYILDLKEANRIALVEEGVKDIEVINICTKCDTGFHSYRRDGKGVGKQLSFVGLV